MLTKELFNKLTNIENLPDKDVIELTNLGYLYDNNLTEKAFIELEPYKVKRAIVIAAGFGSRMVPVTLSTPKPLVKVNGKRIIETLLDALVAKDIKDIYIIRGYKKEQFDILLEKYPFIKFIDNDAYNEANNISSVYMAKDLIDNSYICEADLLVSNPDLIQKYQYNCNYLGFKVAETDDWALTSDDDLNFLSVNIGGINCHQMVGISFWNKDAGKQLAKDVEDLFITKRQKTKYWDEVPLRFYKDNYSIKIRECKSDDILEIDTYEELKKIDSSYL